MWSLSIDKAFHVILSPPLTSISKKDFLDVLSLGFGPWVTSQSSKKNVMLVEDKIHWVELDQKNHRNKWQAVFLCSEIGSTELYSLVAPTGLGGAENDKPVEPISSQRKHSSPQLTRQVRSHKGLQGINWMVCNELDAGNAEQKGK